MFKKVVGIGALYAFTGALVSGCDSGDAPKAWSELSTCLAGSAAADELPARIAAVRAAELNLDEAKPGDDGWPGRCAPYANALHASISDSGATTILKRLLAKQLGCTDGAATCALPTDGSLVSLTTELWDAAKGADLTATIAANVKQPAPAAAPLLDAGAWKTLKGGAKWRALTTRDQGLRLLMSAESGRGRPGVCELPAGFASITCFGASAAMPEVPVHTLAWARSPDGLFAAALSDSGLASYDLKTGERSDARGSGGHIVRSGLGVEPGEQDAGFVAVRVEAGKADKPIALSLENLSGKPTVVADHVLWLATAEGKTALVASAVESRRVKEVARLEGPFSGDVHSCEDGSSAALATWGRRKGLSDAKPTAGADETQVTVALLRDGKWTGPHTAALPFERALESSLVCTSTGVSLAWVRGAGDATEVGRLDCTAEGCKAQTANTKLTSEWWWAVTPVGDSVLAMWRGMLGEARFRVAPIGKLADAHDVLLFDDDAFGGPAAGAAEVHTSPSAALLLFKGEAPTALRLGADGSAKVLSAN